MTFKESNDLFIKIQNDGILIAANRIVGRQDARGNSPSWSHDIDFKKLSETPRISAFSHGAGGGEARHIVYADENGKDNMFFGWSVNPKGDGLLSPRGVNWNKFAVWSRLLKV